MKNVFGLMMGLMILGTAASAHAKQCSAECRAYDLDAGAFVQELPGKPTVFSSDWQSLNDSCRAMVAGYANTHIIMKNFTLSEVVAVNTRIPSPFGFGGGTLDQLRSEGFKVGAVLMGKIGEISGPTGNGALIGYPTEAEACK